uniref:Uncharacterized protein n=1 Tax=Romanomermis culicivorax TaxID=13658 RepID=A0A915HRC5_ROMCU
MAKDKAAEMMVNTAAIIKAATCRCIPQVHRSDSRCRAMNVDSIAALARHSPKRRNFSVRITAWDGKLNAHKIEAFGGCSMALPSGCEQK